MAKKNGYYVPLPEDFLDQPKTQKLIARYGLGAVTIFHDLQTRMRDYETDDETSFMIPMEDLSFLCYRYHMNKEQLQDLVNYFYAVDLLKIYEIKVDEHTSRFIYSKEMIENLKDWTERRDYMKELSKRGVARRRLNKDYQTENEV